MENANEALMAKVAAKATGPKRYLAIPERNATGKKTMQKVTVETSTGAATSDAPLSAASKGSRPSSTWRTIASTTTIDWSIRMPMTKARPPMVIAFSVAPQK